MPDLFDIERSFAHLGTEVGERTAAPGAAAAIGRARRRRTTIAAGAAVALIAIGSAVTVQATHGGDRVAPAGPPQVPAPAPLDGAALDAASHDWVTGWHVAGKDDQSQLEQVGQMWDCLDKVDNPTHDPTRAGNQLFVGDDAVAIVIYGDFGDGGSQAGAWESAFGTAMAGCVGDPRSTAYGDGSATASSYVHPAQGTESASAAWLVRLDNRVGLMFATGSAPPSDQALDQVGSAVMAALQVDDSYRWSDSLDATSSQSGSAYASGGDSQPPIDHQPMDESDLAAALDGWSSWSASGSSTKAQVSCLTGSPDGATSGSSSSLGTTAEQSFHDFASSQEAQHGVEQLMNDLASCDSVTWNLDYDTIPNGIVASSPHAVVWVAKQGRSIAVLTLGDATDPPAAVASAVGDLLRATLG